MKITKVSRDASRIGAIISGLFALVLGGAVLHVYFIQDDPTLVFLFCLGFTFLLGAFGCLTEEETDSVYEDKTK